MKATPLSAFPPGICLFKICYEITGDDSNERYILAENFREVEKCFQTYFDVTLETLVSIERLSELIYFPVEWGIPNKVPVVAILT